MSLFSMQAHNEKRDDVASGLRHHLEYDVELGERTVMLADVRGLTGTTCSPDHGLSFHFNSSASCRAAASDVLVVGARVVANTQLRCAEYHHRPRAAGMLEEITDVHSRGCDGRVLRTTSAVAQLHHVIKRGRVRLTSNRMADAGAPVTRALAAPLADAFLQRVVPRAPPSAAIALPHQQRRAAGQRLVGVGGFFDDLVQGFEDAVSAIVDVATTVASAVASVVVPVLEFAVTGSYSYSNTWAVATFGYDYPYEFSKAGTCDGGAVSAHRQDRTVGDFVLDSTSSGSTGGGGGGTGGGTSTGGTTGGGGSGNCSYAATVNGSTSFQFGSDVAFSLDLEDYTLNTMSLLWQGSLTAGADLQLDVTGEATYQSRQYTLGVIPLPDITFEVAGIPFVVHSSLPVNASFTVTAESEAQMRASAQYTGTVNFGITYDGSSSSSSDGFQYVHDLTLKGSGSVTSSSESQGTLKLSFLPTLVTQVDYIGGPTVGFEVSPEMTVATTTASTCPPVVPGGALYLTGSLNIGASTTIGADIDIVVAGTTVLDKQLGPFTVWQQKWPLWSGCLVEQADDGSLGAVASAGAASAQQSAMPIYQLVQVRDAERAAGSGRFRKAAAKSAWDLALPAHAVPTRASNATAPLSSLRGHVGVHTNAARRAQSTPPAAFFLGSTWTGQQLRVSNDPTCAAQFPPAADLFVQGIPDSTAQRALISFSGFFETLGFCNIQLLYGISPGSNGLLTFTPLVAPSGDGYQLGFSQCAYVGNQAPQPMSGDFEISADYNTLTAVGGSDCVQTVLQRNV